MISTPRELVEMMAASVSRGGKNPVSVYDPFARNGDLLAGALQKWYTLKQVQGSYTSGLELKLATLRLLCNAGADTEIVLSGDLDIPDQAPRQFDLILSNPPFGAKASDDALHKMHAESLDTLAQRTRRLDVLFLGHILDSLSAQGQAAVLLPAIFISGNSLGKAVIAELLAQNVLDMVVELPHGLFTHTGIAPVLLCLSKTRNADQPVWLLDATAQAQKQGRQSRLNLQTLLQWLGQIKAGNSEEIKEITAAKPADIEAHEYNLYRMLHSGDSHWHISREPSSVLYDQCLQLEQKLAVVQEKMKTLLANPIQ
ncbi:HsdM family class I SAM-dependent methyltransferase [Niabella hibiscisoli]|uniref:HsdM family class I SAM-dependent methyltransferase n=1 Tax=Niabella hibiscisoli TaxID=1825928 RepID=UPI001F0D0389|nr:N-6 DNA methylase [Niabella hibiscisoli]MCH5719894.1 SAM-dependent methyltransferase [Niabella hibiscisoli]